MPKRPDIEPMRAVNQLLSLCCRATMGSSPAPELPELPRPLVLAFHRTSSQVGGPALVRPWSQVGGLALVRPWSQVGGLALVRPWSQVRRRTGPFQNLVSGSRTGSTQDLVLSRNIGSIHAGPGLK
jgi:hypothetical protein